MTDKQILDRLHNINLSRAQKMDLINVIKDIAKENSSEDTPTIPPELTIRPIFNIVCQYNSNTTNLRGIYIFNEDVGNNSVIKYNDVINYFGLGENFNTSSIVYSIIMFIVGSMCNITMYKYDINNGALKPITDFEFIPNISKNSFTITYRSPTDNSEVTIVCNDNKNNGFEISW